MRILGVDPGSRLTGFGVIEKKGNSLVHHHHGVIRLSPKDTFEKRLYDLFLELSQVIEAWKPEAVSVEKIFFAKNVLSALKLGQARGVVLLCAAHKNLPVFEYSATEVKQALSGYGRADKDQVSKMVQLLLGKQKFETLDASDALAIALCHSQRIRTTNFISQKKRTGSIEPVR